MKCPKCRSEVGKQSVCPYCGGTVFVQGSTWSAEDFSRSTLPVGQIRNQDKSGLNQRELDKKLRGLETKVSLLLILQCGEFALIFLMLIVLALS